MDFGAVLGFSLVVTVLLVILRKQRPEIAVLLTIAAAGLILGILIKKVSAILAVLETMAAQAELNRVYWQLILKIVGFAYLAGFGAQICRDAGENSMAAKIELAGKISILSLGLPVLAGLVEVIFKIF
ncbi:MAG: stage III sporulation protein AD [Bacillota bacterium]|jgi:stage III sporulation protein AD